MFYFISTKTKHTGKIGGIFLHKMYECLGDKINITLHC